MACHQEVVQIVQQDMKRVKILNGTKINKIKKQIWCVMAISVFTFFVSCNDELTVDDFFKKVSEAKEYKKEITQGDFVLTCQYRPSELICLSEMVKGKKDFKFDRSRFNEELKKYSNAYYIDFTVGLSDGDNVMLCGIRDRSEYAARLGELTYLLTQDFYMLQGQDSIKAMSCVFSNTYGNSPNAKFMFVFPKRQLKNSGSIDIIYADKTFGIPDKVVFTYDMDELNKEIPKIIEQKR